MGHGYDDLVYAVLGDESFEVLDHPEDRSALDVLTGPALSRLIGDVPAPLRQIAQAEAQLRQMLTTPGASAAN